MRIGFSLFSEMTNVTGKSTYIKFLFRYKISATKSFEMFKKAFNDDCLSKTAILVQNLYKDHIKVAQKSTLFSTFSLIFTVLCILNFNLLVEQSIKIIISVVCAVCVKQFFETA